MRARALGLDAVDAVIMVEGGMGVRGAAAVGRGGGGFHLPHGVLVHDAGVGGEIIRGIVDGVLGGGRGGEADRGDDDGGVDGGGFDSGGLNDVGGVRGSHGEDDSGDF